MYQSVQLLSNEINIFNKKLFIIIFIINLIIILLSYKYRPSYKYIHIETVLLITFNIIICRVMWDSNYDQIYQETKININHYITSIGFILIFIITISYIFISRFICLVMLI